MVSEVNNTFAADPGAARSRAGIALAGAASVLRHPVVWAVGRRLFVSVPLLLIVPAIVFVLTSLSKEDAAQAILRTSGTPDQYRALRHQLHLDLPVYEQYWRWLTHAIHGDLGASLITNEAVTHAIAPRMPVTLSLICGTLLVSVAIGIGLGVLSAVQGGALGRGVDALAMIGWVLPGFWIAAELIVLFAVKVHWFPVAGYVPFAQSPTDWLRSLVLPVAALGLGGVGIVAKQTREAMLDVLGSEYIRIARANGIPSRSIVFRHALKSASVRVLSVLGILAIGLIGGTVFAEIVFGLPGLGSQIVSAADAHDTPLVLGVAVYFTVMVIVINLVIDLAYGWVNPRVRAV
jgi:peptide/nickel transport system permease protein